MTECERIIKNGILPESFFKEEVRNEFVVDENRKKIWAIELDLLFKFDEVCRKNNLKYHLASGSLLGAIRHKGFIPWDDDLDVAMHRDDYEKLLKLSNEFCAPYFLQTPETDSEYAFSFAKLRNSNTTAISKKFLYAGFNKGIFLDIFPLDNFIWDGAQNRYDEINKLVLENSTYMRMNNPNLSVEDKDRVLRHSGEAPIDIDRKIQKIASQFDNEKTDYIAFATVTFTGLNGFVYNASDIETMLDCEYEGYTFPIPCGYDNILKKRFGDYMSFPPVAERGILHSGAFFDPDKPYTYYLDNKHLIV